MKKVKKVNVTFEKNKVFDFLLPSIFFSLAILLFLSNFINLFPNSFNDRVMGNALMFGIDVTKRVNSMYLFLFFLFPLFTFIINCLLNKIKFSSKIKNELNILSSLGIINLVMLFIMQLKETNLVVFPSLYLLLEMILLLIFVSIIGMKYEKLNVENINWAFVAVIPFMLVGSLFLNRLGIKIDGNIISLNIFFIGSLGLFFISNLKFINFEALKKSYVVFLASPIIESIYLETYNILNQYNIIINRKILFIFLIYIFNFILFLMYYFKIKNKKIEFNYKKIYYPIVIIIFSLIISEINLVNVMNTDFFEMANHGESVFEFFRYGKIPVLETFDAHMLRYEIWGYIYQLLNNDIMGAIFCFYCSYEDVIIYIILYIFLKKILDEDMSFLTVLLLPLANDLGTYYYAISIIVILTLYKAYEKNTYLSFGVFWLTFISVCLWRLDAGYASLFASIIILFYLHYKSNKKIKIKTMFLPLISILGFFSVFYIGMCVIKNINPILRGIEFLKLAMSNVNWATNSMGNLNYFSYIICYFIIPIVTVISLTYIFYKSKKEVSFQNICLIFLSLFFIFNFQRGMVRHSLFENQLRIIVSFSFLYFSLFLYQYFFKENKKIKFAIVYTLFIMLSQLLLSVETLNYTNILNIGSNKYNSFVVHNQKATEKVERFVISKEMKEEYEDLKMVLNALLNENETFVDLTNQTLLYALLEKEKPVYVNQSPSLLSGELSQQLFLKEIKEFHKNIPIILKAKGKLLSESLDAIPNDYRYYLISEATFKNFEPIAIVNNYEIWVKKEQVDSYIEMLKTLNNNNLEIVSKSIYLEQEIKNIDLKYLPYMWGNYDNKEKEKIVENKHNEIIFELNENDKIDGNYVEVEIDSKKSEDITLIMFNNEEYLYAITFTVKEGTHKYLIRVSSFYSWYEGNVNKITINNSENNQINYISILKGDTLRPID